MVSNTKQIFIAHFLNAGLHKSEKCNLSASKVSLVQNVHICLPILALVDYPAPVGPLDSNIQLRASPTPSQETGTVNTS